MTDITERSPYEIRPMRPEAGKELFCVGSWVWEYIAKEDVTAGPWRNHGIGASVYFVATAPTIEAAQAAAIEYVRESYELRLREHEVEFELRMDADDMVQTVLGKGIAQEGETVHLISPPSPLQPAPDTKLYCLSARYWRSGGGGEPREVWSSMLLGLTASRDEIIELRDLVTRHAHDPYPYEAPRVGRMLPFLDSDYTLEQLVITRVDVI